MPRPSTAALSSPGGIATRTAKATRYAWYAANTATSSIPISLSAWSTFLIETKENVKDASRKSRHVPSYYGKVLFLTKDQTRLKWVKDDGSLGSDVDLDDLTELREYLRSSIPQQT